MSRTTRLLAAVSAFVTLSSVALPVDARHDVRFADLRDLNPVVDHPLVPLASVPRKTFSGQEIDPETGDPIALRVEETVRPEREHFVDLAVTVVEVNDYHDGTLVKTAAKYFVQGADGAVYALGERIDKVANGLVVGHGGTWLAGEAGNEPGLFMPADPAVGDTFQQERIPGIAEEESTVIASDQSVTTAAGSFAACIVTRDVDLRVGSVEHKTYCPGVGLVRTEFSDGQIELTHYRGGASDNTDVEVRQPTIDEGQDLLMGAAITLEESIAAAQAAVPGTVGEVDMEVANSGIVFVVDVGSSEVRVDAETGEVLSIAADASASSTDEETSDGVTQAASGS